MSAADLAKRQSLERARELVSKAAQRDAKVPDRDLYDHLLKQARTGGPDGCLYTECQPAALSMHKRPQFELAAGGFTQMPLALKQAASEQLEYHMFMGLFPQIHRAWMTIDHMLFLWDYTDPRGSFYQYDGLDQTIIHATLVRPRRGAFAGSSTPQWLLLLSTPLEVVVLAVYCSGHEFSQIDIHETGFSVPSDGAKTGLKRTLRKPPRPSASLHALKRKRLQHAPAFGAVAPRARIARTSRRQPRAHGGH